MAEQIKKVMVVGASGNIGVPIVKSLLKANFDVSALSRKDSKSTFPEGVTVVKENYDEEGFIKAFKGQDAVLSATRTEEEEMVALQFTMIDAAIKAGVKRFLPSEYGADSLNPKSMEVTPFFIGKGKVVEYLKTKEKDGLTWTGIATGPFFDFCLATNFLDVNVKKYTACIWDEGNVPICFTTLSVTGDAVAASLSNPAKTKNQYLYIASVITTQNEIVERLEKDFGQKFERSHTTIAAQIPIAHERLQKGEFMGGFRLLVLAGTLNGEGSDFEGHGHTLANKMLGLPEPSMDESMKEVHALLATGMWMEMP